MAGRLTARGIKDAGFLIHMSFGWSSKPTNGLFREHHHLQGKVRSISREMYTQFVLCCVLLWLTSDQLHPCPSDLQVSLDLRDSYTHILQNYFAAMRQSQDSLKWRHNGRDGVSNHQPHDCLLNRLFRCKSKKTSKLRVTGLCVGNSPVTGEFPSQRASNAENVSIWWRHHGYQWSNPEG